MSIAVKICGLRDAQQVSAAASAGARYLGFVFFDKSPRHVTVDLARELMLEVPSGLAKVALTVNASDQVLDHIVSQTSVDMLQLHGNESVARVAEVKARFGLPVMKAIGVAEAADLVQIDDYAQVADQLLVDAKAPKDAKLPGGNGLAFDWRLLQRKYWACPWMLAGGLDPSNLAEALKVTGAKQVDVSSGVETAPGIKDERLMAQFCAAARGE